MKFDFADGFACFNRLVRCHDLNRQIEQHENSVRRDNRGLQNIKFIGQIADRLKKLLRILHESDDHADCQKFAVRRNSRQNLITAEPNDERDADCADEIHERIKNRVIINRFDIGVAIIVVNVVKTALRFGFGVEKLNGLRAGNMFLQKSVEFRRRVRTASKPWRARLRNQFVAVKTAER